MTDRTKTKRLLMELCARNKIQSTSKMRGDAVFRAMKQVKNGNPTSWAFYALGILKPE